MPWGNSRSRRRSSVRKATADASRARDASAPCAARDPAAPTEIPCAGIGRSLAASGRGKRRPRREVQGSKPVMNDQGKSNSSIVPEKSLNKAQAAEGMEGSELAKGKTLGQNTLRAQGRGGGRVGRRFLQQYVRCSTSITSSATTIALLIAFFSSWILPLQSRCERKSIASSEKPKTFFPNSALAMQRNCVAR